jgi:hypothetical protein
LGDAKPVKVRELIEELGKVDPELTVTIPQGQGGLQSLDVVDIRNTRYFDWAEDEGAASGLTRATVLVLG